MALRPLMSTLLALVLLVQSAYADGAQTGPLSKQLEINRDRYGIAGQALLVLHNGQVIFRGADGAANVTTQERVTTEHVFPVYSLSKLFVSALVMQLVEQRKVDLDAPASTYVEGLPSLWQAIPVRDFLDHTSGIPEYFGKQSDGLAAPSFPVDLQAALDLLADTPLQFTAGTETRYTQTNYLVLSSLLAAHYRKPYQQVAEERIIRRLDLRNTWLGPTDLPEHGVVTSYLGMDSRLQQDNAPALPAYASGHGGLYLTLDDLGRFLQAMTSGELVSKGTLHSLWQPRTLPDGRRGWFASGWEYEEVGAHLYLGHDGGARDRIRIVLDDSLDGDVYIFVYLTNGSSKNAWSRTLVDSAMAAVSPSTFPREALTEALVRYALQPPTAGDAQSQAKSLLASGAIRGADLERAVNDAGYAIRENLGIDPALRVFELNIVLFPDSANAWDSLAETYATKGEPERSKAAYSKAQQLSSNSKR